jgi:hypothetical protein
METIQQGQEQVPFPKTKEAMFADIVHTSLYQLRQELLTERPSITKFFANGKEYPITDVPGGVLAIGQTIRASVDHITRR